MSIVFDGGSYAKQVSSLNMCLHTEPNNTNESFDILIILKNNSVDFQDDLAQVKEEIVELSGVHQAYRHCRGRGQMSGEGFLFKRLLNCAYKKKSKHDKSRNHGGQAIAPPHLTGSKRSCPDSDVSAAHKGLMLYPAKVTYTA
ncbi:hypothetical protein CDAR_17871 [Caerostris darwini]|uniref:Uncharacterized protein n=1 Tax=Caerostris darwini TaxID=1538125 RepID=A0AAV4MBX6_9ARAC|nr:hypothetical protein CDAR_17871 [Caerostris darwini]